MTETIQAKDIIKNHVLLSMGASMVPLPGADVIALGGIQMDMIQSLCENYKVEFSQQQIKAAIGVLVGTGVAQFGAKRLLKLFPGVGSIVGGIALATMAGASTYALGEVFKAHFESGGTLLNFDLETLKNKYNDLFSKGQSMAPSWASSAKAESNSDSSHATFTTSSDIVTRLKDLAQMRETGIVSEDEFQRLKKKIVDGF